MSLEEKLEANTAALNRNSDLLERVVAGQQAAMAQLEGGKAGTGRGRGKKAEEAPSGDEGKAPTTEKAAAPAHLKLVDEATLTDRVKSFTGAVDGDDRQKRIDFLKAAAEALGLKPSPKAIAEKGGTELKKFAFYLERQIAGKPVDFKADYDFDGEPTQDAPAVEASDDSDFG